MTTIELGRGHVNLVCVLIERGHIVHNNIDVGCRIKSMFM